MTTAQIGLLMLFSMACCAVVCIYIIERLDRFSELSLAHDMDIREQILIVHKKVNKLMQLIDDTLAAVQAESSQIDSVVALITSLEQQVKDAVANSISADDQTKLQTIFDTVKANAGKVTNAINANTPAAAMVAPAPEK